MKIKRFVVNNRSTLITTGFLTLIVGLGIFLRFYHIGKLSFWLDEALTASFTMGSFSNLIKSIEREPNMSLYYSLAFLWNQIFQNPSEGTQRALSAIFSVASIPIVFLLGKNLVTDQKRGSAIGLVAAFLIAINVYHIEYAQEFRSYSLTFLLTAFSTFLLIKVLKDEEAKPVWLIIYTIISAASVYSHLHAMFIIVAQTMSFPFLLGDKKKYCPKIKHILYSLIGIVLLILPIAVLAIHYGPKNRIDWLEVPRFAQVIDLYIRISGYPGNWMLILYIVFSCFGLFTGVGFLFKQDIITKWKFSLLASCLLLPVILAFVISKIIVPIFLHRYLLFVMPYLVLLTSSGIVALANLVSKGEQHRFLFIPTVIIAVTVFSALSSSGVQSYYENHKKDDLRNATKLLSTKCSESLRIYYPGWTKESILYYNPSLIPVKSETVTNFLQNESATLPFSNGYDRVCLVLSHIGIRQTAVEAEIIRCAIIQNKFTNLSVEKFFGVTIEIYQK